MKGFPSNLKESPTNKTVTNQAQRPMQDSLDSLILLLGRKFILSLETECVKKHKPPTVELKSRMVVHFVNHEH